MDNSVNNLDCTMDYQENNSEQKLLQVPNTVSSINDYETSSYFDGFVAPKVPKLNDNNTSAPVPKIDLKTCDFDDLLIHLSKNVIGRNILEIYNFLKGKDDVLEFRGVNNFMEEILVRIVRNVDVLQSQKFNRHCMRYCNLIIDLLKNAISNKIFMVACLYMNETDYVRRRPVVSKLLVYKKLYYTSHYESQMEMMEGYQTIESVASMSCTPPISPSTSMDSLDSQRSLLLEKHSRIHESDCTDVTDEISIRRANRKLKKSTKRHQAFINQLSPDFIVQCLKKMLSFLSDESEASVIIAVSTPEEKKFTKNIINFCRSPNIKSIFDDEPRRILDELNELVDKATNYKLRTSGKNKCGHNDVKYMKIPQFKNPPVQQTSRPWYPRIETVPKNRMSGAKRKEFLQTVPVFHQAWRFGDHVGRGLLHGSTANDSQPSTSSDVSGAVSKESKKPPRSNINFQSAGVMNQKVKNEDSSMLNCERDPVLTEMMLKYVTPDNKMMVGMGWKGGALGTRGTGITEPIMPHLSSFKPMPPKLRGKEGRNDQLIEALSVPVQIDKAVKMMVGMGWKGGALGARGTGITEPIMPHLSSVSGAGFGHIKLQKLHIKVPKATSFKVLNNKRSPHIFRKLFLNNLLTLLTSSENSKTVNLPLTLNKKEHSFLRHTINTFARRSKVKMESDGQAIIDKIEAQYAKDLKMAVTACVSNDGRQLVLTKIHVLEPLYHSDATRKQRIAMAETMTDNVKEYMDNYGPLFFSQKSLEVSTFRVGYLLQVLKLVKDNSLGHIVMDFETAVTYRQKNLVHKGIMHINKKNKFGDTPEAALSREIKKFMGCYRLRAKFNKEYTSLKIRKEYLKPRSVKEAYAKYTDDEITENDDVSIENNEKINENKNVIEDKDKMSETEDNIKVDVVDSHDVDDILIGKERETNKSDNYDMDHDEIKTETENINTQSSRKIVTIENSDAIVKVENTDNGTNKYTDENDEIVKTAIIEEAMDDDNENKLNTSSISEYSTDDMSLSDPSGFTANLDYSETEDDICDNKLSDDKLKSSDERDKLGLSLKSVTSKTALNVDLGEQSQTENKSDVKIVYLTKNYLFSKDTPKYIQGLISFNIIKKKELPLLECHGVHSNALIYSCHTKESYNWLQNICIANDITTFTKELDKMSLKINSFFDFDDKYLFNLLELYNKEISTKDWNVLKKEKMVDCVVFEVKMDKKSVKFILDSNLALYAGVDKVTFSIIWE